LPLLHQLFTASSSSSSTSSPLGPLRPLVSTANPHTSCGARPSSRGRVSILGSSPSHRTAVLPLCEARSCRAGMSVCRCRSRHRHARSSLVVHPSLCSCTGRRVAAAVLTTVSGLDTGVRTHMPFVSFAHRCTQARAPVFATP
jgi:hypothetical protein